MDHERRPRGPVHGLRDARPLVAPQGAVRVRRSAGYAGPRAGQERGQDGSARERHACDPLRRRPRSRHRNGSARKGQGFQIAMKTLDRSRAVDRCDRGRDRAARARREPRLRARAAGVRRADRRLPGGPVHARRHGEGHRGGAGLLTRQSAWMLDLGRRASKESSFAKCFSTDMAMRGDDRRGPDLRRQRLHEGVPRREADARRQAHADLRRHQPDPTPRHRPRAPHLSPERQQRQRQQGRD